MLVLRKKICLLGDFAVGKTSLVQRFVYNVFEADYMNTIGIKVSRKTLMVPTAQAMGQLDMLLWDITSDELFERMQTSYLRGAAGAVLIGDLTRRETCERLIAYAESLRAQNGRDVKFVVGANKADLTTQWDLTDAQIGAWAAQIPAPYYFTSAKTGATVEAMFRHLGQLVCHEG